MHIRILSGVGGVGSFIFGILLLFNAKEVTTEHGYLFVKGWNLIFNLVGMGLFGIIGVMLTVWAFTPRR